MPRITIANDGRTDGLTIENSPVHSILNALQRNQVKINHVCGGKAQCGTCRVRIVEGSRYLSPKNEREIRRLQAMGAPSDVRLACQTYAAGDITIEIPQDPFPEARRSET